MRTAQQTLSSAAESVRRLVDNVSTTVVARRAVDSARVTVVAGETIGQNFHVNC
jgi:hypothetical protein